MVELKNPSGYQQGCTHFGMVTQLGVWDTGSSVIVPHNGTLCKENSVSNFVNQAIK